MSSSKIINYVSRLLPIFKKDLLVEQARILDTELFTKTIPAYKDSAPTFKPRDIRSKQIQTIAKNYFHTMGGNNTLGLVGDIHSRLENIHKTVGSIRNATDKDFEDSVVVDGITLYKVSLMKALELCGFISRYSLRFLNYLFILESAATNNSSSYIGQQLSKGEIKEIELHFSDYCRALKSLSKDPANFVKELDKLPNVTVGPQSEVTLSNIGSVKLDPIDMFNTNGFFAAGYRVGMMFAEISVSRYKEAKELKTSLELRKIFLENLRASGKEDPATQKEIDIIQSRIDRCAEQIRKAEEEVGL